MSGVINKTVSAAALAPGRRALLVGFPPAQVGQAQDRLRLAGWEPTSFTTGVDVVVVPDGADAEVRRRAGVDGHQVDDLESLCARGPIPSRPQPAWVVTETTVEVCGISVPRALVPDAYAPEAGRFRHLCLDAHLLRSARTVALAARDGVPCLLEGPTAAAKTTAVLWVAHLLGAGVWRLNLDGQSDTGELVGRFLPTTTGQARTGWRFHEGAVPQAMRQGRWVLLDELNLAEPQVLERLNSALEDPPGLVLSEHDGTRFGGGGGVAVHPGFRLLATMNPAEYAGRQVLSPAFRDRWGLTAWVPAPEEIDLRQMLCCLATGEQPLVPVAGRLWQAPASDPALPRLAGLGADRLDRLAGLHHALSQSASKDGNRLGAGRRERLVFTRRTLLTAVRLTDRLLAGGAAPADALREALHEIYLERLTTASDRSAVLNLMQAAALA